MDSPNLLEFNSPLVKESIINDVLDSPRFSPGNNPFDDVVKKATNLFISNVTSRLSVENPFDNVLKKTFEPNILDTSLKNNSLNKIPTSPLFNTGSPFKVVPNVCDIGRESVPFNFKELDLLDAGRPSLNPSQSFDFGRESLGILNLSNVRESLGILNLSSARESLGILHTLSPDVNFGRMSDINTPALLISKIDEEKGETEGQSSTPPSCLNAAFLAPHITKESVSSTSSLNFINPSFSSKSFASNDISKIYSISSATSYRNLETSSAIKSDLNNAYNSEELSRRLKFSAASSLSSINSPIKVKPLSFHNLVIDSPELKAFRLRILSLPAPSNLENKLDTSLDNLNHSKNNFKTEHKFWSVERTKKKSIIKRHSFSGVLNFEKNDDDDDVNFNDSVFIEANYIASKIADGSIAEAVPVDNDLLNNTSPPELFEDNNENDPENEEKEDPKPPIKCDTESVFKAVDKMLPVISNPNPDLKFSLKLRNKGNNSATSNGSNKNTSNNVSRISDNSDKENNSINISKHSNASKSRDTKDILQNLSEILNASNRSDVQKFEGQHLLHSLADILNHSRSNSMEDSGHSSIVIDTDIPNNADQLDNVVYEVLDLRKSKEVSNPDIQDKTNTSQASDKACVSQDNPVVLDLSIKDKVNNVENKRLSQSFNCPGGKVLPLKFNNSLKMERSLDKSVRGSIGSSVSSNDSRQSVNSQSSLKTILPKFRVKKGEERVPISRKGPLKAVIPIGNMAKRKSPDLSVTGNVIKSDGEARPGKVLHDTQSPEPPHATPKKIGSSIPSNFSKRTSTPKMHHSKMKPVAQSTPDFQTDKLKSVTSISSHSENPQQNRKTNNLSLIRPRSSIYNAAGADKKTTPSNVLVKEKTGRLNSSSSSLPTTRRNSVSDVKKSAESNVRPKRCNSTGKEVGIMSALSRVRENITKSPYYKGKGTVGSDKNEKVNGMLKPVNSSLTEMRRLSRIVSPLHGVKKTGKENKGF